MITNDEDGHPSLAGALQALYRPAGHGVSGGAEHEAYCGGGEGFELAMPIGVGVSVGRDANHMPWRAP